MRRKLNNLIARKRARTARGAAVVLIAGAVMLAGCGREEGVAQSAGNGAEVAASVAPASTVSPAVAVQAPLETVETLPPDLEVEPVDTLVAPGESVDLVVQTTSDVTRVAFADGSGETQAFVYDQGAHLWKLSYRVPLRPRQERWGVSITARTEANRWRRVWVFLRARDGTERVSTVPDTAATVP